jgi:hypothetical protein
VADIFPRWTNLIPLIIGVAAPIGLIVVITGIWYWFSPQFTDVGYQPKQPIPFSHQLHAGSLGIDCRYCHNTVEQAGHAAVPPSATCWGCHGDSNNGALAIALNPTTNAPLPSLQPLFESYATKNPIQWVKVHMLPDYAYFNHSAHISVGVGCASCHGRIDQMEVVRQAKPLSMGWCLECHRDPEPHIRPSSVPPTRMDWDPEVSRMTTAEVDEVKRKLDKLNPPEHCSGCHR